MNIVLENLQDIEELHTRLRNQSCGCTGCGRPCRTAPGFYSPEQASRLILTNRTSHICADLILGDGSVVVGWRPRRTAEPQNEPGTGDIERGPCIHLGSRGMCMLQHRDVPLGCKLFYDQQCRRRISFSFRTVGCSMKPIDHEEALGLLWRQPGARRLSLLLALKNHPHVGVVPSAWRERYVGTHRMINEPATTSGLERALQKMHCISATRATKVQMRMADDGTRAEITVTPVTDEEADDLARDQERVTEMPELVPLRRPATCAV